MGLHIASSAGGGSVFSGGVLWLHDTPLGSETYRGNSIARYGEMTTLQGSVCFGPHYRIDWVWNFSPFVFLKLIQIITWPQHIMWTCGSFQHKQKWWLAFAQRGSRESECTSVATSFCTGVGFVLCLYCSIKPVLCYILRLNFILTVLKLHFKCKATYCKVSLKCKPICIL